MSTVFPRAMVEVLRLFVFVSERESLIDLLVDRRTFIH